MANLIKVNHVERDRRHRPEETMGNILRQVFGDKFKMDWHTWQGVKFRAIYTSSYGIYGNRLQGIQMTTGSYGERTIRRVMINKDGCIDTDAIIAKFAELKATAEELEERRKKSAEYQAKCQATKDRIARAVDHPEKDYWDYPIQLKERSPTEVIIEAKINGSQHQAIDHLLGEQKVKTRLTVPEDKAVEVYKIMKGEGK